MRNVNDAHTKRAIDTYQPDFVVVSGTNLLGKRLIHFANEHTGGVLNFAHRPLSLRQGGSELYELVLSDRAAPEHRIDDHVDRRRNRLG